MYTSHGHQITGTIAEGRRPLRVARCGGPGLCTLCSKEAIQALKKEDSPTMETQKYVRKPFDVEAVQVTDQNMEEVRQWCSGTIVQPTVDTDKPYIQVDVKNPMNDRQTRAFANDWVLFASGGFKVYANKAFRSSFDKAPEELRTVAEPADATPVDAATV